MNFYTQNGWAGSNYDSKLSTKEISAKVRAYAKKNFPGFKFSIRTEYGTSSMYIELKSGTNVPFIEGSRSAERGYMSTMSSVKAWEDELTPKVFAALNAVSNYASSFRYNDSDGMQDYFDTNFYIHIEVSDEYKVIEPKAKKSSIKTEKAEEAKEMEAVTVEGLEMVDYSDKAIAVFGDTKQPEKLGNIHLIETGNFNGVRYYNIEGAGIITSAKVREGIQPGDVFNVYTAEDRQYGVTYDGVSLESSLKNDLPGIIEFNGKIESGTLSASSHYTPMDENVEFYEKKVKGKRYITENKPKRGYYYVIDTLDNCPVGFFQTKGEAEKETEILNGFTDGNGRLKTVI